MQMWISNEIQFQLQIQIQNQTWNHKTRLQLWSKSVSKSRLNCEFQSTCTFSLPSRWSLSTCWDDESCNRCAPDGMCIQALNVSLSLLSSLQSSLHMHLVRPPHLLVSSIPNLGFLWLHIYIQCLLVISSSIFLEVLHRQESWNVVGYELAFHLTGLDNDVGHIWTQVYAMRALMVTLSEI